MKDVEIAQVAHEANRALCLIQGDKSQLTWEHAPDWQKDSAIIGVRNARDLSMNPEDLHNMWMIEKESQGWIDGPVKDPDKKHHPCMVPYDELPLDQKIKDALFLAVVRALI